MNWMCHRAFSKRLIKDRVRFCPKCLEDGKKIKMDYIVIDPEFNRYPAWGVFLCPACHYEVDK